MRNILLPLLLCILFCQPSNTSAQTTTSEPRQYQVYAYMKVAPAMEADYLKLEKAWKKIHLASKKAGQIDGWSLSRVLSPGGAAAEYNYVARNGLLGDEQLANFYEGSFDMKGLESLLTKEELGLVNRTDEIRTMVKVDIFVGVDRVEAEDWSKGTVGVVNYFRSPEGKTTEDHAKMEAEIWKPVHAARIKDGKMLGWYLQELYMPFGADMPYNMISIDLYKDMKQSLAPWFENYFQKVHPKKEMSELMKQTSAVEILAKGELRQVIDRLDWK